ncbi:MAG: tetratricopeptide repeat protein [Sedimentisphaerales bacterium]
MYKTTNKYHIHLIYILLTIVTFIAFEPIMSNGFISFDDDAYIYHNSNITTGLTGKNIGWAFTNIHANNYHPLTSLSHMLDCQFFKLDAGAHHSINLLLHIANTLLLFTVLSRMTKRAWASAFVAALFALHPLHVESVAWASERKDVLSTFFLMLTLLAYAGYVKRPGAGRYLLTLVLFVLGLLSKQMLVTVPFILLLLDYWPLERFKKTKLSSLILEKIPFLVLSAALGIVTVIIQHKMGLLKTFSNYPFQWRIENAIVSYIIYIEKMFWPVNLAIFYPHPKGDITFWQVAGSLLILLFITFLAIWKIRRWPYVAVGWLWFLVTLVPVIGIVQVGLQGWADRYTYVPYIGLFIIAWVACDLPAGVQYQKTIFSLSACIILLSLGAKTFIQTLYWQNNIMLYSHAAEVVENNWWAYNFMGKALASQDEFNEAIVLFEKSLAIYPQNITVNYEMGKAFLGAGDANDAVKLYQQMLGPLPDNPNEPVKVDDNPVLKDLYVNANINLAIGLSRQGNLKESARRFEEALRVAPDAEAARKGLEDLKKQAKDNSLLP